MAVQKEVFANAASCVATSTFGMSNPGSGTPETWTMGTGSTSFPVANHLLTPATIFYVSDPADTTHELIMVTDNNSSGSPGTSWSVTRGVGGTSTVAHAALATYVQVIGHPTLQNFKQAPSAAVSTVTVNSGTETTVATYTPTADEITVGATWEAIAFGSYGRPSGGAAPGQVTWKLKWNTNIIASCVTGTNGPTQAVTTVAAGQSFDVNGSLTLTAVSGGSASSAVANINYWWQNGAVINNELVSNDTAQTASGSGPITLTCTMAGTIGTNQKFVIPAPLIYRAA